jgi:hypothetical protein
MRILLIIFTIINQKTFCITLIKVIGLTKKLLFLEKKKLFFENISIKRIKFKPGYSRLWRLSRVALKFLLSLKFQYQQKLTKYLSRFLRLNKFMLVKYNEFKLLNLLTTTLLLPDRENSLLLITNRLVFLNSYLVTNEKVYLFVNDFLQLIVSLKYYILFKWIKNLNILKKKRLGKFAFNLSIRRLHKDRKKPRQTFPQ